MPELPEVETTLKKIKPHIEGFRLSAMLIRRRDLRWPISAQLPDCLSDEVCQSATRRGKYLLLAFSQGSVIIHLGMSGSLRWVSEQESLRLHDHVVFVWPKGRLVYHDPRRFGCILWHANNAGHHKLLRVLGVEPLTDHFDADWLFKKTRASSVPIKTWLMNHKNVVGVGNIYANEALFHARISPFIAARRLTKQHAHDIVFQIKRVLSQAIASGGSTLRDYVSGENEVGHFQLKCVVYGRAGMPCTVCGKTLFAMPLQSRQTVYCMSCQNVPKKYCSSK